MLISPHSVRLCATFCTDLIVKRQQAQRSSERRANSKIVNCSEVTDLMESGLRSDLLLVYCLAVIIVHTAPV